MSRRVFLSSGAAAGIATVALGGAAAERAGAAPTSDIDAMILQVAAAAAVFPVRVTAHEHGPALARPTAARVAKAWARTSRARAEQARRGARRLIERKLGGASTEELLARLSALAAEGDDETLADLNALVAVAGATLADEVDPENELLPRVWLRTLANMHKEGARPIAGATR